MPQSILVQVGQCGNQVGFRFWEAILREYHVYYDDLNPDHVCHFLKPKANCIPFSCESLGEYFKPRAVLIDMEEGVISEGCRGFNGRFFQKNQILTDVSGSGNNWAVGNKFYGRKYLDSINNLFRREAEDCDNLESFILFFSLGGGTGSGLGTAVLESLHDEFSKIPRLVFPVFPSVIDDVITSPYNAVLSNYKLSEYAQCVIPFENQVLNEICMKIQRNRIVKSAPARRPKYNILRETKPFDDMNDLIANTVLDFTSSSRYPGSLNIDMNDIVVNMAPFPRLHYLIPSGAPFIFSPDDSKMDQVFNDLFSTNHQLFGCSIKESTLLSATILGRGHISVYDLQNNVDRLGQSMKFVPWNEDGWKFGLCDIAPANRLRSLLMLSNTSGISHKFNKMKDRFIKMFSKRAHMHHFSEVDPDIWDTFNSALAGLADLIHNYEQIEFMHRFSVHPRPAVI